MTGKEITRRKKTKEYNDLATAAYQRYPEDKIERVKYVKVNGTKQDYLLYLLCILQDWATGTGCRFDLFDDVNATFDSCKIGGLFSAISLAVDYLDYDTPDEILDYIIRKLDYFVEVAIGRDNL